MGTEAQVTTWACDWHLKRGGGTRGASPHSARGAWSYTAGQPGRPQARGWLAVLDTLRRAESPSKDTAGSFRQPVKEGFGCCALSLPSAVARLLDFNRSGRCAEVSRRHLQTKSLDD